MIYRVECTYCGKNLVVQQSEIESVSGRCTVCKSKRRIREYEVVDGYVGCPPFPKPKDPVEEAIELWRTMYD